MSWLAILSLLKRIPWQGWALVALCALLLALRWHWIGVGEDRVQALWDAQEAVYAVQRAEAAEAARKAEERHRAEYRAIADRFLKEQADADQKHAAMVADLRRGTLRLRDRFTCPSVPGAAGDAGRADAASPRGLQREDQEFLLRIGREADEVARRLNALIEAVEAGQR
jgi:hypothetical protein